MVIVVNTLSLKKALSAEQKYFISKLISILSQQQSQHQFYIISADVFEEELLKNVSFFTIKKPAVFPQWQTHKQIKRFVKKIKAGVLISYGTAGISGTAVPQCMIVDDVDFLAIAKMIKSLAAATGIAALSDTIKKKLVEKYKIPTDKIITIDKGINESFLPVEEEQHQQIKNEYTGGKEYFIYAGDIHPDKNIITLLKAFSLFKKRQKTTMKLVLTGTLLWDTNAFTPLLNTYKYREDVVLLHQLEEKQQAQVLSAAYAFIYPAAYTPLGTKVLEAMHCGVPVLAADEEGMKEAAGDAGLFFDATQIADIANKMTQMYIDENLRKQLIENGKRKTAGISWLRTAHLMWQCLEKAAK